jgi:hypothetical protein
MTTLNTDLHDVLETLRTRPLFVILEEHSGIIH